MLDAFPAPDLSAPETPTDREIAEGVLAGLGLPAAPEAGLAALKDQIQHHLGHETWTDARVEACLRICRNNVALLKTFVPTTVRGTLLLFTAQRGVKPGTPGAQSWAPYFPDGVLEYPIDQDHLRMLNHETIPLIAAAIKSELAAREQHEQKAAPSPRTDRSA